MKCGFAPKAIYLSVLLAGGWATVRAQPEGCDDEVISAMRTRGDIGASDQRRIADWVEGQLSTFSDMKAFRACFKFQYENPSNSSEFRREFAAQTSALAAVQFARPDQDPAVAHALARVLLDMAGPETTDGLLAGLQAKSSAARYLSARGLVEQRSAIGTDKAKTDRTVEALRNAALSETSPAVLGRIYEALAFPNHVDAVFDSYIGIFDERLKRRRSGVASEDGAEYYAFEYFRTPAVLAALDADQKNQLVNRVAVFLRQAAERFSTPGLDFDEVDRIERLLDGAEAILSNLVGPSAAGGNIREALSAGGYGNRSAVLQEAYRWVGDPTAKTAGALNAAPWNVPLGAP